DGKKRSFGTWKNYRAFNPATPTGATAPAAITQVRPRVAAKPPGAPQFTPAPPPRPTPPRPTPPPPEPEREPEHDGELRFLTAAEDMPPPHPPPAPPPPPRHIALPPTERQRPPVRPRAAPEPPPEPEPEDGTAAPAKPPHRDKPTPAVRPDELKAREGAEAEADYDERLEPPRAPRRRAASAPALTSGPDQARPGR